MKYQIKNKQPNSRMCLVCGLKNPYGLKTSFYELENGELLAIFTPANEHQGYPGRLHGGMAMAILDEAIGRAIMIKYPDNIWGVTADFNIRFKKPIPLDQEIRAIVRVTEDNNRIFEGTGEIYLQDGSIAAAAKGKYFKLAIETITSADITFDADAEEWRVVPGPTDPEEIEI